jgi:hypothetical protein
MKPMHWVPVEVEKPADGQAVLVRYSRDNWLLSHTLSDGVRHTHWRWQAAIFRLGRTADEVAASGVVRPVDQHGNNLAPYKWLLFGPGELFGHEVTHWAAITDPMED